MKLQDEIFMARAVALAQKGRGQTSPNPCVGAVVVRSGKVVSEGYHLYFGGPHAERVALRKANGQARDATLYVSLEPCSTWGKTPPCVDTIIAKQIKRVVIASLDPNPQNHQGGVRKLRKAGIQVRVGVLAEEARKQNEAFFKRMQTGFPFVTLKIAQSLDGKIATTTGESRWISSKRSREFVHSLRSEVDAILVGKNTALRDNPRLRGLTRGEKPWRIVLDPDLELSPKARLFEGPQLTFVAIPDRKLNRVSQNLGSKKFKGQIFLPIQEKRGKLELRELLKKLAALGVNHLLVEGGGEVAWSLIDGRLVDRLIWIIAPKIIGGRSAKTSVEGEGVEKIREAYLLDFEKSYRLGEDWVFVARPRG